MSDTLAKKAWSWPLILAFAVLYISWGTTYLAMRYGVQTIPPFLFSGLRLVCAGFLILVFLSWRGESLRVSRRELFILMMTGCFFFMGGNGFLSLALMDMPSGLTAVITSPTPLVVALLELFVPRGDRLTWRGWLGLSIGCFGVLLLSLPILAGAGSISPWNLWFAFGSTVSWAIGSLWTRHAPLEGSPFRTAGYQLFIGGIGLSLLGLALGEGQRFSWEAWTPSVCASFVYLLAVGSLAGFCAFTYVLAHTSTAMAGTYSYVNPVVALVVGAMFDTDQITLATVACMMLILSGVALVRLGGLQTRTLGILSVPRDGRVHVARPGVQTAGK
jgi:drug/metabolite transporter (DMT)-like permease